MRTDVEEGLVYRYLLGDLSESEELALERRFLLDDEVFERVWDIENRIVDHYVRGRLNATEKELFEQNYLASPVHRERVALARKLVEVADSSAEKRKARSGTRLSLRWWSPVAVSLRRGPWRWAAIAAMLTLAVAVVLLFSERARLQKQIRQLNDESAFQRLRTQDLEREMTAQRDRSDKLAVEIERLPKDTRSAGDAGKTSSPKSELRSVVSFLLGPMLMRSGGEAHQLKIAPETQTIVLQMKVRSAGIRTFQVALRTVEGAQVWSKAPISARPQTRNVALVSFGIPARRLVAGDYVLTLSSTRDTAGVEEMNRYFFRVIKQ